MTRHLRLLLAAVALATAGACKAGPSAFDRTAAAHDTAATVVDTVDARPKAGMKAATPSDPTATDSATARPAGIADGAAPDSTASASAMTNPASAGPAADSASSPVDPTLADSSTDSVAPTPAPSDSTNEDPAAGDSLGRAALHFEHPEHVRGLYVNAWAAGSARRMDDLVALARRTEINTFVIDIKDASGYVSHRSRVPLAKEIGADGEIRIHDLPGLLRRLHDEGIYPIARIVVVKDPILTKARPDLAIHDTTGNVFKDDKGIVWVNPYSRTVWDYDIALAKEVARMGFPEIQWDYIRFPDIPEAEREAIVYPGADTRTKAQVVAGFLSYARKQLRPLGVRMTADVFGVTASATRDVGIGQVWTSFIKDVDVAQPMVYPSHYWKGSFGYEKPNAYPYEVVRHALRDALRQSAEVKGAGALRPWLQDFTLGKPPYEAAEVRAQIQAAYDSGVRQWFLWNAGSNYTESALEPKGGFTSEPMVLVDKHVVPVSKRWEYVDSAQGTDLPAAPDSTRKRADTTLVRDTLAGPDTLAAPDTSAAPDTTGAGGGSLRGIPGIATPPAPAPAGASSSRVRRRSR